MGTFKVVVNEVKLRDFRIAEGVKALPKETTWAYQIDFTFNPKEEFDLFEAHVNYALHKKTGELLAFIDTKTVYRLNKQEGGKLDSSIAIYLLEHAVSTTRGMWAVCSEDSVVAGTTIQIVDTGFLKKAVEEKLGAGGN